MTLIKDADELEKIVRQAETMAGGEYLDDMAGTGGPAPAAPDNGEGGAPSSAPSPASFSEIADLMLLLINGGYVISFGPRAVLPNDLQHEAKRNLEILCAKYLPATVGAFGPESALAAVLILHTVNCYRLCQINAPSPGSSASAEAASQP